MEVTFAQRLNQARAFVFDFYGTLVLDDVCVPAMWEELNALGYHSSAALQSAFEPDAFDGCTTPAMSTDPSHDDWIRANWRRFVALSGVPEELRAERIHSDRRKRHENRHLGLELLMEKELSVTR